MKRLLALLCAFMMVLGTNVVFAENSQNVKVEAESYVSGSGVRNYQNRGTGEVISINANGTASYSFAVIKSGRYELHVNYATSKTPEIVLTVSGEDETVTLPSTGGNNTYGGTKTVTVALTEGEHTLSVKANDIGFAIDYFEFVYAGEYETGLSDENKFEAEDVVSEEYVSDGASGKVAKLNNLNPIEFEVNAFSSDVYKFCITYMVEENSDYLLYLEDELLYSGTFKESSEYVTFFVENIRIPVGKSKITIEVESAEVYIDYAELIKNKKELSENEKSVFEAESYDASSGDITASGAAPRYISFSGGKWVSFDIDVEKSGKYKISANGALAPDNGYPYSTIGVYLNNEENELCRGSIGITEGWVDFKNFSLGSFILPEGNVTLMFKVLYAASHIDSFTLEYLGGECELDTVYTDEDILANDTHLSKGTDRFCFLFNQSVDEKSINENTIKLESADGEYPFVFSVKENVVTADLEKSLVQNADYVLTVSGVKDEFGYEIPEKQYFFVADGADNGEATIQITESVIDYDKVKIKGVMYSKNSVAISGRTASLIFDGDVVSETVSKDGGEFELLWTVPQNAPVGVISFSVGGEYVQKETKLELLYLSETFEESILNLIKSSDTADKVFDVLSENETALNINLKDLTDGTKEGSVFSHLAGVEFERVFELTEKLHSCSLLEKINGAEKAAVIENIVYNEENAKLLNLVFEKISDIENNRQDFIEEIIKLREFESLSALSSKINDAADTYACKEFGKNTAKLVAENKSLYVGEGAKITLGFTEKETNVKSAIFEITSDESSFLQGVQYKKTAKGNYEVLEADGKFVLKFEADVDENEFDEIAVLTLGAADSKGDYKLKLKAEVVYETDKAYTITYKCEEEGIDIKVLKRASNSTSGGGSQSSRPSSGGSKIETLPQKPTGEKEDEKTDLEQPFKFNDVADTMWAKDYIYALLEKGVISRSEDKKFNPDSFIKREEFIKMVVAALGIYDEKAKSDLKDISGDEWFAGFVASAQKRGLISGRDDGTFGVGDKINREEMATILWRATGIRNAGGLPFADDDDIAEYAKGAVYSMRDSGLISGFPDNTFKPKENATRAQAAKIIYMMMEVAK